MGATLFVMLTNKFPFSRDSYADDAALLGEMQSGTHQQRFEKPASREVRKLVAKLLAVNEDDRMTMEQALKNTWVSQRGKGFVAV